MNAATGDGAAPAAAAANPFAALFQTPGAAGSPAASAPAPASGAPNVSPLPNPWAPAAGAAAGAGAAPAGDHCRPVPPRRTASPPSGRIYGSLRMEYCCQTSEWGLALSDG